MADFEPFNFECPYCFHKQVVTEHQFYESQNRIYVKNVDMGYVGSHVVAVGCSNPDCQKLTLAFHLKQYEITNVGNIRPTIDDPLYSKRLMPESAAKHQPDYIPPPLREDYEEACKIRDLSPKASATLARRCLQGMIRDFCGISKGRLIDEIRELKKRVEEEKAPKGVSEDSVEAIDAVRNIGNIGAHMEKDINLIIEVDSNEAQTLIELIETLFEEWYVARKKRHDRFGKIMAIAEDKKEQKQVAHDKPKQIEDPDEG
ncbi:MAG: DUF4145 domain-containing protein [Lentilitoribacter sp.]|uniref:DUF4145 domain-containing protein n=1 Tax=Tateyamaria sp. TaxID=1929288 RepID=UPI0032695748